jgi:hypothetical protein
MKKLCLLLFISFIFAYCKKDNLTSDKDIPEWLKLDIKHQEQVTKDTPKLMNSYGGWIRYNWRNENYFEYHNPLSSSFPRAISFNKDTLHISVYDVNTNYYKEKCCKTVVWKAPKFSDLPDR